MFYVSIGFLALGFVNLALWNQPFIALFNVIIFATLFIASKIEEKPTAVVVNVANSGELVPVSADEGEDE